jgi:DNA-binding MarR family transcriptional regulator
LQKTNMSRANFQPEPAPDEEEVIVSNLLGIAKLLSAEFRQIAADNDLSDCLAGTLWHVHRSGQIKASDLARNMSCDMGNLSGSLDRLESAGLVERVASGADRRVRLMQLTQKGRRVAAQIENRFKGSTIHHQLGRMTPRERYALSTALGKMYAALSTSATKNAGAPTAQVRRLPT